MKKESNISVTKENPTKDFNKELYPIEKEEREIVLLEKSCNILSTLLKVEMVITLAVMTFSFIFNGFSDNTNYQTKQPSISVKADDSIKI